MAYDLAAISVVVTRAREQAGPLVTLLEERGADVIVRPTIRIELRRDSATRARFAALATTAAVDGIVVTSSNAARALRELGGHGSRTLPVFAIGAATADALHGFSNVRVGEVATADGLLRTVLGTFHGGLAGKRFVVPQSSRASETLEAGLRAAGADVDVIEAYDTHIVDDGPGLPARPIDWITFTSPSAVEGFVRHLTVPADSRIACIGETTRAAAIAEGLVVSVSPTQPSLVALVDGIASRAR